jgi:protein translocase SecG subunit
MAAITGILPYIQLVVAVLLIVCILLQRTGASMGGAFGGDNFSAGYHTRRGSEKTFFYATIVLGVVLVALSLATLLLQ